MGHLYKLDDYENKIVILYSLKRIKQNPTYQILSQVVSASVDVAYFEMQSYLNELIEMGSVKEFKIGEEYVYSLTEMGEESSDFFNDRLPNTVREKIEYEASVINNDKSEYNKICADYIPLNENEYKVECKILENNVKMLDFSMYVGPKEKAQKMCSYFKNHTNEFYMDLLKYFEEHIDQGE